MKRVAQHQTARVAAIPKPQPLSRVSNTPYMEPCTQHLSRQELLMCEEVLHQA